MATGTSWRVPRRLPRTKGLRQAPFTDRRRPGLHAFGFRVLLHDLDRSGAATSICARPSCSHTSPGTRICLPSHSTPVPAGRRSGRLPGASRGLADRVRTARRSATIVFLPTDRAHRRPQAFPRWPRPGHASAVYVWPQLRPGDRGRTRRRPATAVGFHEAIRNVGHWGNWYAEAIPAADQLFDDHLQTIANEGPTDGSE